MNLATALPTNDGWRDHLEESTVDRTPTSGDAQRWQGWLLALCASLSAYRRQVVDQLGQARSGRQDRSPAAPAAG